ncbi:MAG TPA: hypothetical protein VNT56_11920 [Acidimicrobiales bacterium]|jgi:hypothetical protein|nr:hypothetical protein [Acidimicrobiales bacterium]
MRRLFAVLAAVALAAAACGGDEETAAPLPPTTASSTSPSTMAPATTAPASTATSAATSEWPTCRRPRGFFSVAYPPDWSTNTGEVSPPCTFFHPEPFTVPEATEVVDLAVMLRVERVPFETVGEPGETERELSRRQTTVAGAPAVVVEAESTGDALLPAGVRTYRYAVDLDGQTLVAATYAVGGLDYETNKGVLDRMMESLTLST